MNPSGKENNSRNYGVILITGTPGVGKSVISTFLASKVGAKVISIGDLVRNLGLFSEVDQERDTLVVDLQKVSAVLEDSMMQKSAKLIIDGHYAVDVIPPENVDLVFVLRKHPEELRRVLEERGYDEKKIQENLAAEILDVCLYEAVSKCDSSKICEFDVSHTKPEVVVGKMLQVLNKKKDCEVGIVDWLGILESNGELDRYLKET